MAIPTSLVSSLATTASLAAATTFLTQTNSRASSSSSPSYTSVPNGVVGLPFPDDSPTNPTSGYQPADGNSGTDPDDESPQDRQQSIVYQYFFVIVAVALLALIIVIIALRRRRRLHKATNARNGQTALARDLESWQPASTARRWAQRYNRFATARGLTRNPSREEDEGFNEYGEAPPPYKAREAALEAGRRPESVEETNMPAVPLRTLSRGGIGKLPDYDEAIRRSTISGTTRNTSSPTENNRGSEDTLTPDQTQPETRSTPNATTSNQNH